MDKTNTIVRLNGVPLQEGIDYEVDEFGMFTWLGDGGFPPVTVTYEPPMTTLQSCSNFHAAWCDFFYELTKALRIDKLVEWIHKKLPQESE